MNINLETMGAEPVTLNQKLSTMFELWKISMTPGSPVAAELSRDPQMKSYINSYRLGTFTIAGAVLLFAIIKKRRKRKKLLLTQPKKEI